jgi:hypothetical protein
MKPLRNFDIGQSISKLINFFRIDIWRIRLDDLPFKKSVFIKPLRILILTIKRFKNQLYYQK